MKQLFWVAILISLAAAFFTGSVLAQQPVPTPSDDQVNRIAHQLYCPVCENTPLDVCPTDACRQWRDLIRQQLSEGWTEDQIKAYFVQQYGARVLAEPPQTGINWLIYILPPLIILAGAFILFRALRMWIKPTSASAAQGSGSEAPADEYVARLEEELKKRN
ncbi:MAG TPA: cytochrome c-type biogenesis protein [Anaerolineales bacterium]|nr:cytochrome c-type biogenesis protein [Anaerolineales bacterium]